MRKVTYKVDECVVTLVVKICRDCEKWNTETKACLEYKRKTNPLDGCAKREEEK